MARRPGGSSAVFVLMAVVAVVMASIAVVVALGASPGERSSPGEGASSGERSSPGEGASSGERSSPVEHRRNPHVHLGDSYASGTGVTPLIADSPFFCQRSQQNFGQLVAARKGWALTDVSCSGATTGDLHSSQYDGVGPQLDALGPGTEVVTLSLGGNDSDLYTTLIGTCASMGRDRPDTPSPCRAEMGHRVAEILAGTQTDLTEGLRAIAERAPEARVFVVGYPWILPAQQGCYDEIPIAAGDVPFVHGTQARLNDVLRRSAEAAGAHYVDVSAESRGHDACAGPAQRWVEPMTVSGPASLHPNLAGQRALADAVLAALRSR
ncbi:SGNH/GDSL hydrolase family protein [Gordonia iterans]|uniref:SGNH/GDSL hydrolase family protein n=1 Tax=Gordonia iterans TaxID=1004901 RepID=UPI00131BA148|nr:SGNH/GDSL hydrolase family protein [Gordonia iterans]